jgi:hypothetical protein
VRPPRLTRLHNAYCKVGFNQLHPCRANLVRLTSSFGRIGYLFVSWRPVSTRLARLLLIASLVFARTVLATEPDENRGLDCGVNALFILLTLEKQPARLDRLESALPARRPDGYSMAELASAARSLGLDVEGVRFAKGDRALRRPAIAFLIGPAGGHYAVIRPVGTTGTMVQVIDPPHVPWIADYDRVFSSRPWTGRILVARDPWTLRGSVALTAGVAGFVSLLAGAGVALGRIRQNSSR